MSKTGVGRGRGWLNLNKSQNGSNLNQIGNFDNAAPVNPQVITINDNEFADAKNDYKDLANKMKKMNVNDDGILFNQKIKYILENWNQECQNAEQVEQSFNSLFEQSLSDTELASKLVSIVSSRQFITEEIHNQNIRLLFVKKLQENYEGAKQMQESNVTAFRNSARLLGEFYHKTRLRTGGRMSFMLGPLITYLGMLLDSDQHEDLQLFTTLLQLNGECMYQIWPERIMDLMSKVRLKIVDADANMLRQVKLWLLLALEIADNRFSPLTCELVTFYKEHLGTTAIADLQVYSENKTPVTHTNLSVQTDHENKILDNYQSNVNVLQVSSSTNDTATETLTPSPTSKVGQNKGFNHSSNFQPDSTVASNAPVHTTNNSVKCGRPILGAGARLNKCRIEGSTTSNSSKESLNSSGWNSKPKSGWGDSGKKPNKGWEHDDRLENDYS